MKILLRSLTILFKLRTKGKQNVLVIMCIELIIYFLLTKYYFSCKTQFIELGKDAILFFYAILLSNVHIT